MKLIPESSHALAYIIQERDVNVVSKYFYANGLMIARVNPFATTYFHQDSLGSTRLTTSASKLQLFASNYKPFGPVYNQSGTEKVKYTGKWEDSATKLYYFGARYYDPEIGRFTTQDPVLGTSDDPQTLNRYPYAKNNPLKYVDPDGRFIDTIFDAFGILADLDAIRQDPSLENWAWLGVDIVLTAIPFIPTFGVIRKTVRHIDDAIRGVRKVDLDDLTAATKKIGGLMDDTLSHRGHFEDMKANGLVEAQTFEAFQQEAKDFVHKGVTAAKSGDSNYKIYAQNDGAYAIVDTKRQIFAIYDPEQDKVRTFFSPLQGDAEHRSITMQQYIEMKLEAGRQGKTEGWRPTG